VYVLSYGLISFKFLLIVTSCVCVTGEFKMWRITSEPDRAEPAGGEGRAQVLAGWEHLYIKGLSGVPPPPPQGGENMQHLVRRARSIVTGLGLVIMGCLSIQCAQTA